MSFIDLNKKNNDGNELLPAGTYEMIIDSVHGDASKGGHENMSFDMIVRRDLDQVKSLAKTNAVAHGRHYFSRVWTAKDANGRDSGKYNPSDLANIADAIGLTQAQVDKYIKSKDDLFRACKGKPIRIYVSVNDNEYNGEKRKQNSTFTNSWQKTKFPLNAKKSAPAEPKDPFKGNKGAPDEDISNGLPF